MLAEAAACPDQCLLFTLTTSSDKILPLTLSSCFTSTYVSSTYPTSRRSRGIQPLSVSPYSHHHHHHHHHHRDLIITISYRPTAHARLIHVPARLLWQVGQSWLAQRSQCSTTTISLCTVSSAWHALYACSASSCIVASSSSSAPF